MKPRKLRIFRIKDGVRIPYVLELDHELTVLAEYADTTEVDHIREGRRNPRKPRVADSPARRIATAMSKWATERVADNPIPGTDDLRDEYFKELEALETKYADKESKCPACEIGKLMRRYREKMEKQGSLTQLA